MKLPRASLSVLLYSLFSMIFVCAFAQLKPAYAQLASSEPQETSSVSEIKLPDPLTPEAIRELVSRLSDTEVRELLLQQLDVVSKETEAANASDGEGILNLFGGWTLGVYEGIVDVIARAPLIGMRLYKGISNFYEERGWSGVFRFFGALLGALLTGMAAEFVMSRLTTKWRRQIQNAEAPGSLNEMLTVLGLRLLLDMIGLITFFVIIHNIIPYLFVEADRELGQPRLIGPA